MSAAKKLSITGGDDLGQSPFAGLSGQGLPDRLKSPFIQPTPTLAARSTAKKDRGRVDILREKAGRSGKTVTVVSGWMGIGLPEKESLAKKMQKACGAGGTVKEGRIEIQGDKREEIARILTQAGFRPVFAGG
jgi:translation initiation factor 1